METGLKYTSSMGVGRIRSMPQAMPQAAICMRQLNGDKPGETKIMPLDFYGDRH